MNTIWEQIQQAQQFIRQRIDTVPQLGIILGTGLGDFTDSIAIDVEIPYHEIPYFPTSTVKSHEGKLIFGKIAGKSILCMAGRFHYYEGYSMQQVTFPIRVMKAMGINHVWITNASGSVNEAIEAGDLVFVKDHINLLPEHPLRGANDERLGPRFPDMLHTYDIALNAQAMAIAKKHGIRAHEGIYVALQGPNLETPAEYNFLHIIGGDLVGMSTVPEVIVAKHSGMQVFVISIVSNKCYPIASIKVTTLEDVIAVANKSSKDLTTVLTELIELSSF